MTHADSDQVVTPEHFPAAALAARPPVKTRKDGTSAVSYPVQFLGAPEYYWSRPTDIKPLSQDEIKGWIDSGKKSSTKGLKNAYQHALKAPSLDELMEAKIALEKDNEDEDEEMAEDDAEEEAVEEEDEEEDEVELDDEGKPVKKSKSKKKSTTARTPKKTPAKTPTKKRKTTGATEEDGETAPSAKKSRATPKGTAKSKQAAAAPSPPASPELTPEQQAEKAFEATKKSVMIIRSRIQKCLLGERCDEKILPEIPGCLDRLDRIEPEVRLGRETKIGKVLTRMNKLGEIPRDAELGIKAHVRALVEKWSEVVQQIRRLDEEESSSGGGNKTAKSTPAPAAAAAATEEKTETTAPADATDAHATNGEAKAE